MDQGAPASPPQTAPAVATPFSLDQFRSQLVYERRAPLSQVLGDLNSLGEFDRTAEKEQSQWSSRTLFTGLGAVLSFIGAVFALANGIVIIAVPAVLAAGGLLIAAIVCGVKWHGAARVNLDNRRLAFPRHVLHYLAHDIDANAEIKLRIDFRHYRDASFLKGQSSGGMFSAARQYQYAVPWLALSGQFMDGHRFDLDITTTAKRKEKSKRKYTKVSETFRERLRLYVRVKPAKFARLSVLPSLVQQQKIATPFAPTDLEVQGETVSLGGFSAPVARRFGRGQAHIHSIPENGLCTADQALQSFLALYAGLELCRK